MRNSGSDLPILEQRQHEERASLEVQGEIQNVVYCQDCGATNNKGDGVCRICHHPLQRKPGTTPCANCQEFLGENALFCSHCGAPVPLLVESAGKSKEARLVTPPHGDPQSPVRRLRSERPGTTSTSGSSNPTVSAPTGRGDRRDAGKDTSSFISEQDLPAWLRQVIATEAAESEAEARRVADEQAKVAGQQQKEAATARQRPMAVPEQDQSPVEHAEVPQVPDEPVVRQQDVPQAEIVAEPAPPVESITDHGEDQQEEEPPALKGKKRRRATRIQADAKPTAAEKQRAPKIGRSDPRLQTTSHHGRFLVLIGSLLLIGIALMMLFAPTFS
jgi:ribosomal protein L40E